MSQRTLSLLQAFDALPAPEKADFADAVFKRLPAGDSRGMDAGIGAQANLSAQVGKRPLARRQETKFKHRHGIPLARDDGMKMTAEEVAAMLAEG